MIQLTEEQLRQIVNEAYEEGHWRAMWGSYTGMPNMDMRNPFSKKETTATVLDKVNKGHKTFKFPERMWDVPTNG